MGLDAESSALARLLNGITCFVSEFAGVSARANDS